MDRFEFTPEYYALDLQKLRRLLRQPLRVWMLAGILAAWIGLALCMFSGSYIQYTADSFNYKSLSQHPISVALLLYADHPPTLPILLKLFKSDEALVGFQLLLFFASWLTLFAGLRHVVRSWPLYLMMVASLALLSLSRELFLWHKAILSESISLSGMVLMFGLLCRFASTEKISNFGVYLIGAVWVAWQFSRDTNAYYTLIMGGTLFAMFALYRFQDKSEEKWKKGQWLLVAMCVLAVFQLSALGGSDRWKPPMVSVLGVRILPYPDRRAEFEASGMPINDKVLCFTGKSGFSCGVDWSGFGDWLNSGKAKSVYQHWLIMHVPEALKELAENWQVVINDSGFAYYDHSPDSVYSRFAVDIEKFKEDNAATFLKLAIAAVLFCSVRALSNLSLRPLAVAVLFALMSLPSGFISYHGDPFEIPRHSINVRLNTFMGGLICIFAALDACILRIARRRNDSKQV